MYNEKTAFSKDPSLIMERILTALEDSPRHVLDSCIEYDDDSFDIEFHTISDNKKDLHWYKVSGEGKLKTTLSFEHTVKWGPDAPVMNNAIFNEAWAWLKSSITNPPKKVLGKGYEAASATKAQGGPSWKRIEFPKYDLVNPAWVVEEDAVTIKGKRFEYAKMRNVKFCEHSLFTIGHIGFDYDGSIAPMDLCYKKDAKSASDAKKAYEYIRSRSQDPYLEKKERENAVRQAKVAHHYEVEHETRKRCNVCGTVFCYTHKDVMESWEQRDRNASAALGSLAAAFLGSGSHLVANQMNIKEVRDFNKCPNCGSVNLKELAKGEATEPSAPKQAPISSADEILKFKQLLDMGVITQEEFDTKKAQLLGS